MKCDNCIKNTGYVLGSDECGAGNYVAYCSKGHWEGGGPDSAEEEERQKTLPDPWEDCPDYEKQPNREQ